MGGIHCFLVIFKIMPCVNFDPLDVLLFILGDISFCGLLL